MKDFLKLTVGQSCVVHCWSLGFLGDGADLVGVGGPVGGGLVLVYEVVGDIYIAGAGCDWRGRECVGVAECRYLVFGECEAGQLRTVPERVGADAGD